MRLTIRVLGCEVLHLSTDDEPEVEHEVGPGDCTSYPVGFMASPGDQRWEKGVDLE